MNLYPSELAEWLDFPALCRQVAELALTSRGKAHLLALVPLSREEMLVQLAQTDECLAVFQRQERFPSPAYPPCEARIPLLGISGEGLDVKDFHALRGLCNTYEELFRYLERRKGDLPQLWLRLKDEPPQALISESIHKVIDERGLMRPDASPALRRISRELQQARLAAQRVFDRVRKKWQDKGVLADFGESVSENRRVLAVQASFKGQLQGIWHGSSNRQKVVYLEPGETVELNNRTADLMDQERAEIRRILRELSVQLAPYRDTLQGYCDALVYLDQTRAKGLWAYREKAHIPIILPPGVQELELYEAFNPVLRRHNQQKEKKTVALNLRLDPEQRLLVISGPNAGGKSLSLKTVGLLQLMLQCGLPIPAKAESRLPYFNQLLGDIGDTQSIENELSTYSAKLAKMQVFLQRADPETLLLIDEFGSGSDPDLGSALAQVFLEKLASFGTWGILTTHFNSIKALAAQLPGVRNAAMLFAKEDFAPTYRLQIGEPGSSYTFEVAQRSGIPPHLIQLARQRVEENVQAIDQLLVQIQADRLAIDQYRSQRESELTELRALQTQQKNQIARLEEKVQKQSARNAADDRLLFWGQKFQKLVESWLNQESQKDKKAVVSRFIAMLNQRSGEVNKEEKVAHRQKLHQHREAVARYIKEELSAGTAVRMLDSGHSGTLMGPKGDKFQIALGENLTVITEREKFVRADAPVGKKPQKKKRKAPKGQNTKKAPPKKASASDQSKGQSTSGPKE